MVCYGVVAIALLPVFIREWPHWKNQKTPVLLIFIFGGLGNLAFTWAIVYGDVVRVMVLYYLIPAWGVLGGRIFLKECIDRMRCIAVVLALLGAFLVLGGINVFHTSPSWIDLVALASGFTLSMNNVVFRASHQLPVTTKISAMFLGCSCLAAMFLLFSTTPLHSVNISNWLYLAAFGLCWIFLATVTTQWAVTHLDVGRASIIIITELLTAVVSAMWIGGERLDGLEMLGGIMIIAAAVLEAKRESSFGLKAWHT